jgi:hypothetical protein
MKKVLSCLVVFASVAMISGCGGSSIASISPPETAPASIDGAKYVLDEEPDGAVGVIAARESANDGEPIVVVGRIGGATNPWIDGRAAFMLLDASMTVVADGTDSAEGQICMDDCCAQQRATSTTLVKVVDASGRVLAADARQLLGVAADDMVVVRGTVSKDENGNFAVLADGVHIR